MKSEFVQQILNNHNIQTTSKKSYFNGDIEVTVKQEKEEITLWAFNHKNQRFLNLLAKKYSTLIDGFKHISSDMKLKEHYIYFTLLTDSNDEQEVSYKVLGYARVSTKSQEDNTSLESQIKTLKANGCTEVFSEVCSGATMDRPKFIELESKLLKGDTLVVTRLDRFTRSTEKGISKIKNLAERGIKVNILNMGIVDISTAMGKMMFTIMSAFAEYEKDCIVERMKDGKEIAKQDLNFKEGRPKKFKNGQVEHALKLLDTHTYKQVEELTGMSKSTLIRAKRKLQIIK
ncbi:recombinase family protein [Clostridium sp.]|uniref:recombinase family protein n=1 Tax=Clostridium sp. TaxID=1506 RepID=UPI003055A969